LYCAYYCHFDEGEIFASNSVMLVPIFGELLVEIPRSSG